MRENANTETETAERSAGLPPTWFRGDNQSVLRNISQIEVSGSNETFGDLEEQQQQSVVQCKADQQQTNDIPEIFFLIKVISGQDKFP